MEDSPLLKQLQPQQRLVVSLYMKSMSRSKAATDAGYSSISVFNNPSVKAAIAEQMTIRAERLRIGSDWVLSEIVSLYRRVTQVEKVLDRDGNPIGEYNFNSSSAVKLLALAGRHVDVRAWDVPLDARADDNQIMERLLRGRQRRAEAELSVDSDDVLNDEEASQVEQVSFLVPLTDPPATPLSIEHEQLAEPAEHYEPTEYESESVHKIEISPEEKLKLLFQRWETGKPPRE